MNAVDTNVLLYIHDPRDTVKQSKNDRQSIYLKL